MTSHSPLLGCRPRCAQQVAENSWGKSKTSHRSYLMAWSGRTLSQTSCNLVPPGGGGVKSNRRIWPTGVKANRIAPSPTADQSEAPYFHDATGASVRSRWTSSIMCGRPNGTEVGSVVCAHRLHQPALHYRVISSKTWSRDEDNQAHLWEAGTSLIHPTAVSNQ